MTFFCLPQVPKCLRLARPEVICLPLPCVFRTHIILETTVTKYSIGEEYCYFPINLHFNDCWIFNWCLACSVRYLLLFFVHIQNSKLWEGNSRAEPVVHLRSFPITLGSPIHLSPDLAIGKVLLSVRLHSDLQNCHTHFQHKSPAHTPHIHPPQAGGATNSDSVKSYFCFFLPD